MSHNSLETMRIQSARTQPHTEDSGPLDQRVWNCTCVRFTLHYVTHTLCHKGLSKAVAEQEKAEWTEAARKRKLWFFVRHWGWERKCMQEKKTKASEDSLREQYDRREHVIKRFHHISCHLSGCWYRCENVWQAYRTSPLQEGSK